MNNEIMTIEQFTEEVHTMIKLFLPEEYQEAEIRIEEVLKNNNTKKIGITIRKNEKEGITPTIYLDDLYEKYKEDEVDMESVMRIIAEKRVEADESDFDPDAITKEEYIRENLSALLLKREENEELLEKLAWEPFLNLAIVYKVEVNMQTEGEGSYKLTKEILEKSGIKKSELRRIAFNNMYKKNKAVFKTMKEVLFEMLGMELEEDPGDKMYVLSNENKVHGAIWMADKHIVNVISKTINSKKFAVLPSSIHEVIIVDLKDGLPLPDDLLQMVKEVNATQVSEQEKLADNVYIYEDGEWTVVD